ncbi:MAG TPA: protein kinase [Gammaproteobacteria bacterium]|nr:protein kinase [Gammaproteobacteria bacterium]
MQLSRGIRLAQYEIGSLIGAGGMGEVYRAKDTKLNRDVAIKLLPAGFSEDHDRLARFQREAEVLASLNHPNIGAIYDLQADGVQRFLVLELVEGETLADRLRGGAPPLLDALEICRQIAAALETAHQKGVLHRDLKPSNVQLTAEGGAKVLDFGLAKVMAPGTTEATASATIISPAQTRVGVILGTAAYMSPEQARGHELDERTDLWSFGCVLYECLTGTQAFDGDDVTETLAAILKSEPDWSQLPPSTPAVIRALLRQCLGKRRNQRLGDARAARLMIEDWLAAPFEASAPTPTAVRNLRLWLAGAGAILVLAGVAVGHQWSQSMSVEPLVTRALLDTRPAERLGGALRPSWPAFALSPNGRTIVFAGFRRDGTAPVRLYRRSLDAPEAVPMTGTDFGLWPFFSPDGKWVGFFSGQPARLRKVPVDGGAPIDVVDVGIDARNAGLPFSGAAWEGDTIYYAVEGRGILAVPSVGGDPTTIVVPRSANESILLPHVLPGAKALLYTRLDNATDKVEIVVQSLAEGTPKTLVQGADARFISFHGRGYLLYMNAGALLGARFDADKLELTGTPVTLIDDVMQSVAMVDSAGEVKVGQFGIARNGTLALLPGGINPGRKNMLAWVGRDGAIEPIGNLTGQYFAPRVSPDGRRVVVSSVRPGSRKADIQLFEVERPLPRRLTSDGNNVWPAWLDNETIVFRRFDVEGSNVVTLNVDANEPPQRFTSANFGHDTAVASVAAGSVALLGTSGVSFVRLDDRQAEPTPLVGPPAMHASLSPDGQRLAYVSSETGQPEVYSVAFPSGHEKKRVSSDGGDQPAWANDGRELYYTRPKASGTTLEFQVLAVPMQPAVGEPKPLFTAVMENAAPHRDYDVAPDGRFLVVLPPLTEEQPITAIQLVLNWATELERRIDAVGR